MRRISLRRNLRSASCHCVRSGVRAGNPLRAPPRYRRSTAARDDLGPADVVQELGIPHQGVREELARGKDAQKDLQPHGLGEHLLKVRVRVRQRVEEPLPVVERHVGVRPLGKNIAGKDGQPGKKGALSASPPMCRRLSRARAGSAESPVRERRVGKLQRNGVGQDQVRRVDHGRARQAVPAEVPLHKGTHLGRVRFEVQVQLLRGCGLRLRGHSPCAGPGAGTHRSRAPEGRDPVPSPAACADR